MKERNIDRLVDLTHPEKNILFNMRHEEAVEIVKSGDPKRIREIDGQFALVATEGITVHLARSLGRPLRYFIAKLKEGPCLVVGERIDTIFAYLQSQGLEDQFHPSYTRMVPAHYVTRIELVGCPDPNPTYERFFTPERNRLKGKDPEAIGALYMERLYTEIMKWLNTRATSGPIGVSFSAGVDSGSVFLLTYHALRELGESPSRLKAFTLSIDGGGEDLMQSREFLERVNLSLFLEPVELEAGALDWKRTIRVVEDYKPLDIQSATMSLALLEGIRKRYPDWKYMVDGDGGDENMKDYPIEENPELTIRSVLGNLMLYHEGWGVDRMKHSLTYSGGLSRGYMRTYAPADLLGFDSLSPYTLPNVIEVSEGIPFIDMTNWDHEKLYDLKGDLVRRGVKAITGIDMPVFPKRRFQHGAVRGQTFGAVFPGQDLDYRKEFRRIYE
ncbi:MAG: asparagine synthase-related protein [Bacteroidales bacterium]